RNIRKLSHYKSAYGCYLIIGSKLIKIKISKEVMQWIMSVNRPGPVGIFNQLELVMVKIRRITHKRFQNIIQGYYPLKHSILIGYQSIMHFCFLKYLQCLISR